MTTSELEELAMRDLAHIGAGMTTALVPHVQWQCLCSPPVALLTRITFDVRSIL